MSLKTKIMTVKAIYMFQNLKFSSKNSQIIFEPKKLKQLKKYSAIKIKQYSLN